MSGSSPSGGSSGTSPRALVILHEPMVGLGNFGPVLRSRGWAIDVVEAWHPAEQFAASLASDRSDAADLVIVLGSTAGVYEGDAHPFIAPELAFMKARLDAERPVLGVCFGAQLVAAALGEEVRRGPVVDVGYRAVTPTPAGLSSPVRHVVGVPVAEWHGDTFDLPAGTVRLASSEAYLNEAFGIGSWMLAVQFHPELTDEMHEEWLVSDVPYVTSNGYSPDVLRAERARLGAGMQSASALLLGEYLDGLPGRAGRG